MSQQNMTDQKLPNGVLPQMENLKGNVLPQERIQHQFNGVHSAHSSRDPSPSARLGHIPTSQLPPAARSIPTSQLPPSRSPVTTQLTQKVGQLSVNQTTPGVSPKFTSTPNQTINLQSNFGQSNIFSPITPPLVPKPVSRTIPSQVNPVLDNVPLGNNADNISNKIENANSQNGQGDIKHQIRHQFGPIQPNENQQISNNPFTTNKVQSKQNVQPGFNQYHPQRPQVANSALPQMGYGGQSVNQVSNPPTQNHFSPVNLPNPQQNYSNQFNGPLRVAPNQNLQTQPPNMQTSTPQLASNNNPINQGPPFSMQNQFKANASTYNNSTPNLYQPIAPINAAPPVIQNSVPQGTISQATQNKPSLHSNRYPTPTKGLQQQSNYPVQPQQQQQNYPVQPQQSYAVQPQQPSYPAQQSYQQPATNYPQQQQLFQQPSVPPQPQYPLPPQANALQQPQMQSYPNQQYPGVSQAGFDKYWGNESYDLLQNPNILPTTKIEAPRIHLGQELLDAANCSPEIFRCTMRKIPESNSLLQKSRLPLGVLIHPFKDLNHLPVIQCNVIVRCRACRTYINPFVYFVDSKRWKCNLCYRINELPEEFQYDPVSKTYGDPSRRPEIKASTIEYIAPAEYMLRPPQPAVYLYLLDISRLAVESGYLHTICSILIEELKNLPGDARTQIGFLAYDSALHFYSLAEGLSQPHEMTVLDIDDVFLPTPDNLLVNLKDRMELIADLLSQLPTRYENNYDNNSALGAALQVAFKMMGATGGRVTVFQASLPNVGPGALTAREDPSQRASTEVTHLNPANDFYKRLALECSGQQIAVDLFIVNSQYVDVATISGISRFSGGCIHHFPLFKASRVLQSEALARTFRRYLTRKIGFEAVMRIRCTRGLSIHTFHGNFFVRSTDLLSLPNINPDAGFGMQVSIDENLSDVQSICFQAALLYTSSKGERRIRVHTMCLPIVATLHDVIHSADQQCIVGILSKMAVDRSMQSNISDAREAFINVAIDILSSYKLSLNQGSSSSGLLAPNCLRVLPLYISALLKHTAFRTGTSTRLDDRVKSMIDMKTKPLYQLIQQIYPDLYPVHNLEGQDVILNADEEQVSMPPRLQLTARCLDNKGAFLLDTGEHMILLVCPNVPPTFLTEVLGVANYNSISDQMYELPVLSNSSNQRLHMLINYLNDEKPFPATLQILRDNCPNRVVFFERLVEDRVENALSYHEFLQHLKTQVK